MALTGSLAGIWSSGPWMAVSEDRKQKLEQMCPESVAELVPPKGVRQGEGTG